MDLVLDYPMKDMYMTGKEQEVLDSLVKAWNDFAQLPIQHPDDNDDFRQSIHRLQYLIGIRELRRTQPEKWYNELDKRW